MKLLYFLFMIGIFFQGCSKEKKNEEEMSLMSCSQSMCDGMTLPQGRSSDSCEHVRSEVCSDSNLNQECSQLSEDKISLPDKDLTDCISIDFPSGLSQKQACSVTGIRCLVRPIKSLDGLTQFPNIRRLEISFHQINQLSISNLGKLRDASISDGPLSGISLIGLPVLRTLDVSNSLLVSADLTGMPQFARFSARNNQLQSITFDEMQYPNIVSLELNSNHLASFDVSQLTNLNQSQIEIFSFPVKLS